MNAENRRRANRPRPPWGLAVVLAVALAAGGCEFRLHMYDQAKYEPYETSELFADGASVRPFPDGTVARGRLAADRAYHTGTLAGGELVARIPAPPVSGEEGPAAAGPTAAPAARLLTAEFLRRGRERYGIFCAPCHGALGDGNGMIVQRGYQRAASYHEARLRGVPDGYLFDVVTRGYGQMPSYASQVPVDDRWAIVAYVRALQLSQSARLAELPHGVQQVARRALDAADGEAAAEPTSNDADATDGLPR